MARLLVIVSLLPHPSMRKLDLAAGRSSSSVPPSQYTIRKEEGANSPTKRCVGFCARVVLSVHIHRYIYIYVCHLAYYFHWSLDVFDHPAHVLHPTSLCCARPSSAARGHVNGTPRNAGASFTFAIQWGRWHFC